MLEADLVLLSRTDSAISSDGRTVNLREGLEVSVYTDDVDDDGRPDNLVANGVVELNRSGSWAKEVKWCCRIDKYGIRHQSSIGT
jgi:hypothetical protein